MQKILTAEQMREVDRLTAEKYGIPSILLMENAAHATARIVTEKLGGSVKGKSFLILCGKGNNGGDGAALARILWMQGANVDVFLYEEIEETKNDARINFEILYNFIEKNTNYSREQNTAENAYYVAYNSFSISRIGIYFPHSFRMLFDNYYELNSYDFIIDALIGTDLKNPLNNSLLILSRIISSLCEQPKPSLVSIDVPTGLNADSANLIGDNFKADLTVTFTAPKLANILPPASNFNGELHIANIGSPQELIDNSPSQTFLAEKKDAQEWLEKTKFSSDSYKNKRGNALLIVGSKNYTGAAVLVGNAAMVSGVGLVTIATSESAQESVSARVLPEVITQNLAETKNGAISEKAFEKIKKLSEKADVLAIGSGLSSDEESTRKLVKQVVENRKTPIVIDADGLNSLSPFDLKGSDKLPLILTPHKGEFLRLLGKDDNEAIKDRVQSVRVFAEKHKVILVLKGERTLIGEPSGKVVINPTGNSGLGKAGNGDNLTGIVTGFIAQTLATGHIKNGNEYETAKTIEKVFEAVVAAVYISGLAGDIAEKKFGKRTMLATDVRECLTEAFKEIENLESQNSN